MTDDKAVLRAQRLRQMLQNTPWNNWFEGKDFTEDWSSASFPLWAKVASPLKEKSSKILEIGSFEGRSAIFWLEFLPGCSLTCIDHFADTKWRVGSEIESRFDKNLSPYAARFTKVKAPSAVALSSLVTEGAKFDLIYIDGSHYRDNVLIDALLSWKLIDVGGLIIFDDYLLDLDRSASERPKDAIDYFLQSHTGEFRELVRGYQIAIERV